jgi:DNA-directed RNA polymerase specialized sigma24 family protein
MDGTEFSAFVRANTSALLRTAYLLTGSSAEAEDLVQDTLTRMYPKWQRVRQADVPLAYVRRSLANNFVNSRRRTSSTEIAVELIPVGHCILLNGKQLFTTTDAGATWTSRTISE